MLVLEVHKTLVRKYPGLRKFHTTSTEFDAVSLTNSTGGVLAHFLERLEGWSVFGSFVGGHG